MLKERRLLAETVAEQLFAAEAAIDAAIAATAALATLMPQVRQTGAIGACISQDALIKAMQTCTELVQARGTIVETHKALSVAQKQIGLGAVAFGGFVQKSDDGIPGAGPGATRHLTPVASMVRAA